MRRMVDVGLSALVGLLLAPVLLMCAVLVRARLGRPVLFRQTRVGMDGREFSILKFRTMSPVTRPGQPDAERDTVVGRRLRALSLDELPQLWNVLAGDMSLIGPRPTLPEQVRHYSPRQRDRHAVRPGLTGWAQVHGRNSITWPQRIELDLYYIEHRSLAMDAEIVWRTVRQLMRPHGVYGDGGVNPDFPRAPGPIDSFTEPAATKEGMG